MLYFLAYLICMFVAWLFFYCASERRHFTAEDEANDLQEQAEALKCR